ncbi:MAG: PCP reductase family protein [Candidatus Marinimicrobia bacterium]|nr:PCP reductase family protein [Candidatus Neomarinimicrobiota bacterium]
MIKSFGFEELTMYAFDVAKRKMKRNVRKVEVIGKIEEYLENRTDKKDEIIEKFKKYIDQVPDRGRPWTEEALKRIAGIPDFVKKMAESVIEDEAKKRKEKVITIDVLEVALLRLGSAEAHKSISANLSSCGKNKQKNEIKAKPTLAWLPEAQKRLDRIPIEFVRKRILKRVENYAIKNNSNQVTIEIYEAGKGVDMETGESAL